MKIIIQDDHGHLLGEISQEHYLGCTRALFDASQTIDDIISQMAEEASALHVTHVLHEENDLETIY